MIEQWMKDCAESIAASGLRFGEGDIACEISEYHETGLRDQFAMAAMSGMLANPSIEMNNPDLANQSYDAADAMLKARETKSNDT